MEKLIFGLVMLLSLSSMAIEVETSDVDSFVYRSDVEATTCIYESMHLKRASGEEIYKVFQSKLIVI